MINIHKPNLNLIKRMYEDHWYTVDDICLRLRYPKELVESIIKTYNLVKQPNHVQELNVETFQIT
jgi:hypothetical protein